MFKQKTFKRGPLALAIAGLLAMGPALAQSEREAQLEARIAELERLVGELVKQQAPAAAPAVSAAPAAPAAPPVQSVSIVPGANPGTRFSYGGFIKVNSTYTDYSDGNPPAGSLARDFYLPGAIPVGGPGESAVFDSHAKQSRFWFATDTVLENGDKLASRIELDFGV
ncbi:MAG: hypothetical protein ACOVKS_06325, partial [Aquimonas sp.]